jgi:hypothetical protein
MIVSSQLVLDVDKSLLTWKGSGDFEIQNWKRSCVKWKFNARFYRVRNTKSNLFVDIFTIVPEKTISILRKHFVVVVNEKG